MTLSEFFSKLTFKVQGFDTLQKVGAGLKDIQGTTDRLALKFGAVAGVIGAVTLKALDASQALRIAKESAGLPDSVVATWAALGQKLGLGTTVQEAIGELEPLQDMLARIGQGQGLTGFQQLIGIRIREAGESQEHFIQAMTQQVGSFMRQRTPEQLADLHNILQEATGLSDQGLLISKAVDWKNIAPDVAATRDALVKLESTAKSLNEVKGRFWNELYEVIGKNQPAIDRFISSLAHGLDVAIKWFDGLGPTGIQRIGDLAVKITEAAGALTVMSVGFGAIKTAIDAINLGKLVLLAAFKLGVPGVIALAGAAGAYGAYELGKNNPLIASIGKNSGYTGGYQVATADQGHWATQNFGSQTSGAGGPRTTYVGGVEVNISGVNDPAAIRRETTDQLIKALEDAYNQAPVHN